MMKTNLTNLTVQVAGMFAIIGLVMRMLLVVGVAFRAVQEERTLLAELPGYVDYIAKVKYRLIPYIW
jgi:protein-S-isoprenylcysteine O-methyltransferase Ste14